VSEDAGPRDGLDAELDAEFGFEPAVSDTRAKLNRAKVRVRKPRRRSKLRRKMFATAVMLGALGAIGTAYATFATSSGATNSTDQSMIQRGQQLYEVSCITCHGANLQGVNDHGPALAGVGEAMTYFQLSTGRMPVTGQSASIQRKTPKFDEADIMALAKYVQSVAGGPSLPAGSVRGPDSDIAEGGELFRVNCASCHGVTFAGAPLSAGKQAPSLRQASDLEMYAAMLAGPESMPVFGDTEITPAQKKAIIAYVQTIKASADPGGSGIDRIGPVSEAVVIWVAGIGVVIIAILWIGAKTQ
jgi:ubiquinol-cytochrome c reductase cytochrome c subunit